VQAKSAVPGTHLTTEVEGFEVTSLVAQQGDWHVRNLDGSEYFLSDAKFRLRYEVGGLVDDVLGFQSYQPCGQTMLAVPVSEAVTFMGPWGTRLYAMEGSMLVQDPAMPQDTYCVHPKSFQATYTPVDIHY